MLLENFWEDFMDSINIILNWIQDPIVGRLWNVTQTDKQCSIPWRSTLPQVGRIGTVCGCVPKDCSLTWLALMSLIHS